MSNPLVQEEPAYLIPGRFAGQASDMIHASVQECVERYEVIIIPK